MSLPDSKSARVYWGLLFLILGLTLVTRLVGLNKGIWQDEYSSIAVISRGDSLLASLRNYDHPPLYFLLLKGWGNLFETSEASLRAFSILLALLTQAVTFVWLKRYSFAAALMGVFLLAVLLILFRYSQEIRHYQLLLLLTTASFWAASSITESGANWRSYLYLTLFLAGAILVHLVGLFVILMVMVFLVLDSWLKSRSLDWRWLAFVGALPSACFLLLYFWFLAGVSKSTGWWKPVPTGEIVQATFRTVFPPDVLFDPLGALADIYPRSARGPLSYYLPDLETTGAVHTPGLGDLEETARSLVQASESDAPTAACAATFLLIRNDRSVLQHGDDYDRALHFLNQNAEGQVVFQQGLLRLTRFE
ncbi:MAG: glycosyltransferase family 39 protein [Candidatus Promineifilaceae bacterium]|nr:glycosyltransferase family 39 protein [Candidatus Promineifilaceae bacterium]